MTESPRENDPLGTAIPSKKYYSFKLAFAAIGIVLVVCLIAQHVGKWDDFASGRTVTALVIMGILAAAAVAGAKHVYKLTTTYHFAVGVILTTIAAIVLGTWILQGAPEADYARIYGKDLPGFFRLFFLHDIFHSLWFNSLLVMMSLSLFLVLFKRKFYSQLSQLGFLFSHLGIIVILIGALIGTIGGGKWFIPMRIGESYTKAFASDDTLLDLGFALKLDDSRVEFYDDGRKIYAYRHDSDRPVKVVNLRKEHGEIAIPGTKVRLNVIESDKRRELPMRHELHLPGGADLAVEVGKTYPLPGGWQATILQFMPHFNYDMETKSAKNISGDPVNPALQVRIFRGETEKKQWLFANMPDYGHQQNHQHGADGTGDDPGKLVYHFHPPSAASVELEIVSPEGTKREFLAESDSEEHSNPLFLDNGKVMLILTNEPDIKDYWSDLSVWENGHQVLKKTIEVNDPLEYKGYMFYQSRWEATRRGVNSGIQVVKDPGLVVVYAGCAMICIGVAFIFYVRPRILRNKAKAIAEG